MRRALVTGTFALLAAALVLAAPAHGKLAAPTPLSPAVGATVDALPPFAWSVVAGASHYEFQVAADAGFNAPVLGQGQDRFTTRNTRATLRRTVPNGTYWWRVRAVSAKGAVSAWTDPRPLRKAWTAAATLQSPPYGATVSYPVTPLKLTWSPVPHAAKYLVYIATDPLLGSLVGGRPIETAAQAFTRSSALAPGTYYWAISPVDAQGHVGSRSRVSSFNWVWPSATTARFTDLVPAAEVVDPQFSWDPVAGAARYEVEVNSSDDFTAGSRVCCGTPTIGTSLSPTIVLRDNTYYWRVRALDVDGNAGVWNVGPSFTKTFDKVPPVERTSIKNLHMRDNLNDPGIDLSTAAGYQTQVPLAIWDPVPGASSYAVDVAPYNGSFCNWTGSVWRVNTAVPAWAPLGALWNGVKPYPDSTSVASDGGSALTLNQAYCIRVRARTDRDANLNDVYGDWTYLDDGTGASFRWTGYPAGGSCSPSCTPNYLGSADYVLPAHGSVTHRTPYFSWKPIAGKRSYFVLVAKDPAFSTIVDYAFTQLPVYSPRNFLRPTTYADETTAYYWAVLPAEGFSGGNAVGNPLLAAAPSFHKRSVPTTLVAPAGGADLVGPPTFQWTQVEGARRYRLQVAQDPSFGAPIEDVYTTSTAYTTNTTYPADTVLYWRVRADDENLIGLTWSATGTFQKRLAVPQLGRGNPTQGDFVPTWSWEPIIGAVSYDVSVDLPDGTHRDLGGLRVPALTPTLMWGTGLFRWRVRANFPRAPFGVVSGPYSPSLTFTRTIGEPTGARAEVSKTHLLLSWESKPGAKHYRVQVASRPDFALSFEDFTTDGTAFAPLLTHPAYSADEPLYWRVAAVDEGLNRGDWTRVQEIRSGKRMRLTVRGSARRGRSSKVTLLVATTAGRPIRGATVRLSGSGVRSQAARTNRSGAATFRIRPKRRGTLRFVVTKTGYEAGGVRLRVR